MKPARITLGIAALLVFTACDRDEKREDTAAAMAPAADSMAATPAPATAAMVNPNDATREQLLATGLDSGVVTQIIAARPYKNMLEVEKVLVKKTDREKDSIYVRTFIPIDINKATAKEIETIPGVGPKMRHEFEEYRPWTSVEQFRREIGKYVDAAEVARLERYIIIR